MLVRRLAPAAAEPTELVLALSAEERTRLRGLRLSRCGQPLLLHLPRGEALQPGERLAPAIAGPIVRVEAAVEAQLLVRSEDPLALLQAAYHLGNRHVALEIRLGELRLLEDPVLAQLLEQRGLHVMSREAPFQPESGAYGHSHGLSHDHSHA